MKRILCLILTLCIIIPCLPVFAAGELSWDMPQGYYKQAVMQIRPVDNYHCYQNSPSFTWPIVYGSTYELVLANNKELTDIAYEVKDIKVNVYTFPHTLEAGKDYYWAVRYKLNGKYSVYTEPRRIYIDEQAFEYTVPPISDIGSMLKDHPRFYTQNDFEKMKSIDKTTAEYQTFKKIVDAKVNSGTHTPSSAGDLSTAAGAMQYIPPASEIFMATMFYKITGEEKYKKYAIEGLDLVKDNDPAKFFEFTSLTDTAESIFSYYIALSYDILYNDLTETQRNNTIKLIERNIRRPFEDFAQNGNYERSLYAEPFGSHQWRLNQCTVSALAIYNESDIAKKLADFHFPILTSLLYPYGNEDGGSGQGPFYGVPIDHINVANYINNAGIANIGKKGYLANAMVNFMYLWPSNWVSSIGDAYNTTPQEQYQVKQVLTFLSSNDATPEYREFAKWMLKRVNNGSTQYYYSSSGYEYIINNVNYDTKETAPYNMPNAKYFPDIDWIGMYSDIKDDNRVGMTFKSSWFGSHNHSHPDQNSFVIEAYGKELARDSNYYVAYHDAFDLGYNKKTYAHNAITYDNGSGQPVNALAAKGDVTDFINQSDFKLAAGDANVAYGTAISKADRKIIYINPETFIVIDDLATAGDKYEFEYWINTPGDIAFYENLKGATITNDNASMEVRAHYPEKITPYYIDFFAGPDLTPVTVPTVAQTSTDKRLYFQTEKTEATKIVTTLDVHKTDERARYIKEEQFEDYLKLSFEDGSVCYVNTSDKDIIVTNDAIEFSGLAFIYNKDSFMLVDGTSAKMNGIEIASSDVNISLAAGKDEVSVSSIGSEANVEVYSEVKPEKLIKHIDSRMYNIEENSQMSGVVWNYSENNMNLNLFPGTYTLYTDKKVLPGEKKNSVLRVTVDGNTKEIPYEGVYDINGNLTADYSAGELEGVYLLNNIDGISAIGAVENSIYAINKGTIFYLNGENPEIVLTSAGNTKPETVVIDEPKDIEPSVNVKVRATDFSSGGKGTKVVWWERIQNNTLQNFNSALQNMSYTFEVAEDGEYDIVMSISTVNGDVSDKIYILNGEMGSFHVPATPVYSDLQGLRIKCKLPLKAGTNRLELVNTDNGQCIFDWIGLIKSDK